MKRFDHSFFEEIGVTGLTPNQEKRFLNITQEELEVRIGQEIGEGLSPDKVAEFETLIENNPTRNRQWLIANHPDYRRLKLCSSLKEKGVSGMELFNELACILWLQDNRPDYQEIVERCIYDVKKEIITNKNIIFPQLPAQKTAADVIDNG